MLMRLSSTWRLIDRGCAHDCRHTNVYEVVSEAIEPLWRMMPGGDGPPLLLDRCAKLVPGIDGYPMPDFYHWLLLPFSERTVGTW